MTGEHVANERLRNEEKIRRLAGYAFRLERIIEDFAEELNARRHAAQGSDPLASKMLKRRKEAAP